MSSNNLGKYEYLTGEDLGFKPSTVEQAKFKYSPLGEVFNKGLNEADQKEGFLKRLKNIEDKWKVIKSNWRLRKKQLDKDSESLKSISYFDQLTTRAKELYERIKKGKKDIDPEQIVCVKSDGTIFNFNKFKVSLDLASNIYRDKSSLKDAKNEQNEIRILLNKLRKYNPTKPKKIKAKKETLSAAEKLLN